MRLCLEQLLDPQVLTMLFAAIAAGATVLTLAMPLLATDYAEQADEGGRAGAREDPPARARTVGAGQQGSLRQSPKAYMKKVVDDFNLNKWLGQEHARTMLMQAGFRGQAPYVTYLFFRMAMPIVMLMASVFYIFVVLKLDYPLDGEGGDVDRRRLFRHVQPEPVPQEQDSAPADERSSAPFPMRSICC